MNSLEGRGFVVIWNGISPGREADFKAWHREEHMPERLAIPGFISGTRWRADDARQNYFTLYTLEGPEVAHSDRYISRLNDPTPWTRRVMAGFRENSRCVGAFERSLGALPSERVAVARLQYVSAESEGKLWAERTMAIAGVVGYHLGRADAAATSLATTERQGRDVREPAGMVIVALDSDADAAAVVDGLKTVLTGVQLEAVAVFNRELALQ